MEVGHLVIDIGLAVVALRDIGQAKFGVTGFGDSFCDCAEQVVSDSPTGSPDSILGRAGSAPMEWSRR